MSPLDPGQESRKLLRATAERNNLIHILNLRLAAPSAVSTMQADEIIDRYALTRRDQMPVLNERGEPSDEWWEESGRTIGAERCRLDASRFIARAEWYDAKETRDAEAKLSERRNKVLAELLRRAGALYEGTYETLQDRRQLRVTVDMVLEARDGARK